MNPHKAIGFLAALLLAFVPLVLAQGTYTQIDVPGSTKTFCWGINSKGDISGYFEASGVYLGFLLHKGTYTTISYSNNQTESTYMRGLNDGGQVVGYNLFTAFVYDVSSQTFTVLPDYDGVALPTGINNAGTIVGTSTGGKGFEWDGSAYTEIQPRGGAGTTWVGGISERGKIVGFANVNQFPYIVSFVYDSGKFVRLLKLNGGEVYGINPNGKSVVGGIGSGGFLFQNGVLTTLAFPGARGTVATGVNDSGEVVGYFTDASNDAHGFTWTPPADAAKR